MKNRLSLEELEKLLPDYLFGELDEYTKLQFEESAKDYPDILTEIESVRSTFSQFEEYDLKASIKQESRNLSVKVQEKLAKKKKSNPLLGYLPKYVYPSLGLLAIVYFLFISDRFESNKIESQEKFTIFSEADSTLLDLDEEVIIPELISTNNVPNDLILTNNVLSDFAFERVNFDNYYPKQVFFVANYDHLINELDEDEFIELLKDLNDENIDV